MNNIHETNTLGPLANLDLNLLVPLQALLQERSVTRAAQRVGLSQPACSSALKRLRNHYQDPLLIRGRGGLSNLTALGESLIGPVEIATMHVVRVLRAHSAFDPQDLHREFLLALSDADQQTLAPFIIKRLQEEAPNVSVRFLTPRMSTSHEMNEQLRTVDARVLPTFMASALPSLLLFDERWVCVADRENDRVFPGMDVQTLASLPWVLAYHSPPWINFPLKELQVGGVGPRIVAHTEGFAMLPQLVANSDRVSFMPQRIAQIMAASSRLQVVNPPLTVDPFSMSLSWHPIHQQDLAHGWFRKTIQSAAESMIGI